MGPLFALCQVNKIIIHPKYDPATTNNDVALLKLKDKIDFKKFDGTVAPICIPESLRSYTGQKVKMETCLTKEIYIGES